MIILILIILVFLIFNRRQFSGAYDIKTNYKRSTVEIERFFRENNDLIVGAIEKPKLHVTLDDLPLTHMKYSDDFKVTYPSLHAGQLKLFLSELQFLTSQLGGGKTAENADWHVVYAGSSPSHKLSKLAEMFPRVKFLLFDPNEHLIKYRDAKTQYDKPEDLLYFKVANGNRFGLNNRRVNFAFKSLITGEITPQLRDRSELLHETAADIVEAVLATKYRFYIFEDFFTEELASALSALPNILFISDIRTASSDTPSTVDVMWNCAQQYIWIKALKPAKSMLKFRSPYYEPAAKEGDLQLMRGKFKVIFERAKTLGIDFAASREAEPPRFDYFDGVVNLQAFPGHSSTETRLITSGDKIVPYDVLSYDDKFVYYNKVVRCFSAYDNTFDEQIGVDCCADCALMTHIFEEYEKAKGKVNPEAVHKHIADILHILRRPLNEDLHGKRRAFASIEEAKKYQLELSEVKSE